MAYKKDQGRYARMSAFWALLLLLAYGCLGGAGLAATLRSWFPAWASPWMDRQPLIGEVDLAKAVTLSVLFAGGIWLHRTLNRPRVADMMIETEAELRKVTWPTGGEAWAGTLAVLLTVTALLAYLFAADAVLASFMPGLMGVR